MPSIHSPNRLTGDRLRRFSIFAAITTITLALAVAIFLYWPRQTDASAPVQVAQTAASWTTNTDLRGVDLFAFTGMNGPKKQLYELSPVDRIIYKRIFEAQKNSDWTQANALIKRLSDDILVGHVLYERYAVSPDYTASYAELRSWMIKYGDHPNAIKIYQLAQKRRQNDPAALPAPQMAKKLFGSLELSWFLKKSNQMKASPKPLKRDEAKISDLMRDIKSRLNEDKVTAAYDLLGSSKTSRMLSAIEYDSLLGEIAAGYYYNGKKDTALRVAEQAVKRSENAVPVAHWIAGLSAWQNKDYRNSAKHFEAITYSQSHNPWMLSAGAFWAARSHERMNNRKLTNDWLHEAASYPRTFYGLISKAKLGSDEPFSWTVPPITKALMNAMHEVPSARRALALLDIGYTNSAQQELLQVHPNGNQVLEKALIATAHNFNLPKLAMRLGNSINQPDGKLYDVALYPIVPWKGDQSVNVDPALINALIRQESQFDQEAQNSRSGAKGLMQLMPSTAKFVSDGSFDAKDLHKPDVNVALGQRYVDYLLKLPYVKGNLIYLAAAYNAGPGNLQHWQKDNADIKDPFLFIESLPYTETRAFIARVMTNYWIYGQRMDQDTMTLTSLSNEKWPIYEMQDNSVKMAAAAF
jgi:soluble lytic murein transglycosylase